MVITSCVVFRKNVASTNVPPSNETMQKPRMDRNCAAHKTRKKAPCKKQFVRPHKFFVRPHIFFLQPQQFSSLFFLLFILLFWQKQRMVSK